MKAKGWDIRRARTWVPRGTGELPPPAASALQSPSTSAALSPQPHPGRKEQLIALRHEGVRPSYSSSHRRYEGVGRSSPSRAPAARQTAELRSDIGSGCRTSLDDDSAFDSDGTYRDGLHSCPSTIREQSSNDSAPAPFVATASASSSYPHTAPTAATLSAMTPAPHQREVSLRVTNQERNRMQPPTCCLLYTSPSPRDKRQSRMPSSA